MDDKEGGVNLRNEDVKKISLKKSCLDLKVVDKLVVWFVKMFLNVFWKVKKKNMCLSVMAIKKLVGTQFL